MSVEVLVQFPTVPKKWVESIQSLDTCSFFSLLLGTSPHKTEEDNVSIIAPHFDEYTSGTGKHDRMNISMSGSFW